MIGYNGADSFPPEFDALLDPFTVMALAANATERVRPPASPNQRMCTPEIAREITSAI